MAEEQTGGQERSESPTPRRWARARGEGRVARSQELSAAAVLLGSTLALATIGTRPLVKYATGMLEESMASFATHPFGIADAIETLRTAATGYVLAALPFLTGLVSIVLLVNLIQAQGVISMKPITPSFAKMNPVNGIKRLFSSQGPFNLLKSSIKLSAMAVVTYFVIRTSWPDLMALAGTGPSEISVVLRAVLIRLALLTGFAFLAVAFVDFFYQRYQLEKSLRMTRQEVVYENRETDGDPMVKGRMRALMIAQARRRMMQDVPKADVVVVNPTQVAVAMKYDLDVAPAPVIVAMGQRKLAHRIRELARKADVPIIENVAVARALLATGKVGKPIPPALYAAVAEVLAFVYRQRAKLYGHESPLLSRSAS